MSGVCGSDLTGNGDRDNPYESIGAALERASVGETIRVLPNAVLGASAPPLSVYGRVTVPRDVHIIADAGPTQTLSEGFDISANVSATLRGFTITHPSMDGITIADTSSKDDRVVIENCVIFNGGASGIAITNAPSCSTNLRLWVKNCVIHGCTGSGIEITVGGSDWVLGSTIENTIIMDNSGPGVGFNSCPYNGGNVLIRYCHVDRNNSGGEQVRFLGVANARVIVEDEIGISPAFVDETMCDFRLVESSAVRHMGNPSCLYRNPDGSRNDLGAYGGPGTVGYYPFTGPVIERVEISPSGVANKIRVRVLIRER